MVNSAETRLLVAGIELPPAPAPPGEARATTRISAIVNETRGITADTALRLGRYLSTSREFWMNLQRDYDLRMAANESRKLIERDVHPRTADSAR
jgi:plasmid maintenance system antidote protein VapI